MVANTSSAGVVIIGAGHAGGRTAERLRHRGYAGSIDVVGIEPELPYERPQLSKTVLTAAALPANALLLPSERWAELGVHFHLGVEAMSIDCKVRRVALSDGSALAYRKLVLATGLSPRRLPPLDPVSGHVTYLRSFEDGSRLRDRLAPGLSLLLVGAGLIGLEVAASASRRGAKVTVVEAAERPLSRLLPARITDWLAGFHAQSGVRILCGRQVVSAREDASGAIVTLDDGACLPADLILVGAGGVPNDGLARDAGLAMANGILVNQFGQTSVPEIHAVGDVASHFNPIFSTQWRLESWKNAEEQADIIAASICGNPVAYAEVPWFWTDQYDLNIQIAGVPGTMAPSLERGTIGERGYLAYFVQDGRLKGAVGIGCGRDIRMAREIIKAGAPLDPEALGGMGFVAPGRVEARVEELAS